MQVQTDNTELVRIWLGQWTVWNTAGLKEAFAEQTKTRADCVSFYAQPNLMTLRLDIFPKWMPRKFLISHLDLLLFIANQTDTDTGDWELVFRTASRAGIGFTLTYRGSAGD
jgi:hypothetical protein